MTAGSGDRPPWFARRHGNGWTTTPAPAAVLSFHAGLPGYVPTPLTALPAVAAELGVGQVLVKDESARLGLPAFKVLGVSWAVHQVLAAHRPAGASLCLVTATDGNHGRAVARVAGEFGQQALVFVPDGVTAAAIAAIEAEGAQVTRVAGNYDDAVRLAVEAAAGPDAVLVQDIGWPGYEEIPGWIVEGYSTLFAEIDAQLHESGTDPAGLVVVPAGVGSLTQAAITRYRRPGAPPTALMTVEPDTAACVLASLHQGEPVSIPSGPTIMTGLNCGTPSHLAWPYLRDGLDAAVAVPDAACRAALAELAAAGVLAGPCGAAALAAVRATLSGEGCEAHRAALGIGPQTTIVLLCTEGATANPLPD